MSYYNKWKSCYNCRYLDVNKYIDNVIDGQKTRKYFCEVKFKYCIIVYDCHLKSTYQLLTNGTECKAYSEIDFNRKIENVDFNKILILESLTTDEIINIALKKGYKIGDKVIYNDYIYPYLISDISVKDLYNDGRKCITLMLTLNGKCRFVDIDSPRLRTKKGYYKQLSINDFDLMRNK